MSVQDEALSEVARDMLLNAQARVGGRPGIGDALDELRTAGLVSAAGNLTRTGLARHYTIGIEEGWYLESPPRQRPEEKRS